MMRSRLRFYAAQSLFLRSALVVIALFVLLESAYAEGPPQPLPRGPNQQCPSGYYSSGSYCKPFDEKSKYAVPREKEMHCPSGYYASGNACLAFDRKSRDAIPRVGQCPSGWYSSGDYCLKFQGK